MIKYFVFAKQEGQEWKQISQHSSYEAAIKKMKHAVLTKKFLAAEVRDSVPPCSQSNHGDNASFCTCE